MTHNEYLELIKEIERHNKLYYEMDKPEITDDQYDELTQRLKQVEAQHPEWVDKNSPSQNVGGHSSNKFQKTRHEKQLLSLNDLFSLEDVTAWHNGLGRPVAVVEQKIDGLTIALTYVNNKLTLGATRGDGHVGEIVTEQAKQIAGIPHTIEPPASVPTDNRLVIRAEVCQPTDAFNHCNKVQESLGLQPFSNPRNCASGGLRAKDPAVTKERGLMAISFQIVKSEGWESVRTERTQEQDIAILEMLGFNPVSQIYCETQQDILAAIEQIGQTRNNLPYWIDGAVIKTNSLDKQDNIGATSKYPLHSVAYKYPAEKKRTTIRDIIVCVGRTGVLAPVAEFDPVQLGGTTVTHATLHNQKFIRDRMINIGAEVEVLKSGEIIPKIVGVPVPAKQPFEITHCPVCGAPAVQGTDDNGNSDTEIMLCANTMDCPAQKLRYFEFFCSRDVMDIRGLGPSMLAALIDAGLLTEIWDIYDLKNRQEEMQNIEGIGERKVKSVLNEIEESKGVDIDRVIKSLGILGVGRHVGKTLASHYASIDDIINASPEELQALNGIGEITAGVICNFWNKPAHRLKYEKLKAAGVNTLSLKFLKAPNGTIFNGMTFVITGTLPTMSRDEMKDLVEANGGKVSGSVSKKTTYLIAGNAAGSKLDKAKNLGVPILSESDLRSMLI